MRKKRGILASLLLLLVTAGCGVPADNAVPRNTQNTPSASPVYDKAAIMQDFERLLQAGKQEKQAIAAIQQAAPHLSAENVNQMVLALEAYQAKAVEQGTIVSTELVQLIQEGLQEPNHEQALNQVAAIKDPKLRNAVQYVTDRGYKIIVPEGNYQAIIDYAVYQPFSDYVTPDLKAYIAIRAVESDSRMLEDAGLLIPVAEVYQRARACEKFLTQFPSSVKAEQVKRLYGSYVDTYFYGQNNTPAFDYETHRLKTEFLSSYQAAAADNTDSTIAKAAAAYVQLLQDNGERLTAAVQAYRRNMVEKLKQPVG